ncbi:MAG TPA: hypothetical protein EYP98_16140, partial [Planctomycetes bacterium]|nr:hypothetical protein [Planctomycetota bacterium]
MPRRSARDHSPISFLRLATDVDSLAAALLGLGLGRGDHVGLIAENRYEWLLVDQALVGLGIVDVPRGSDTTPTELQFILAHSGCTADFAEDDRVAAELIEMKGELPKLKHVIVMADATTVEGALTLGELLANGVAAGEAGIEKVRSARQLVQGSDLLTIVYTSGTTADPKGVVLTHQNVLSNTHSINQVLGVGPQDTFLSVLPAWHVYERIIDYLCLSCGGELVYTSRRKIKEDLRIVQPTVFAAVPRIWENIHDGIVGHCNKLTGFKKRLMNSALESSRAVARRDASLFTKLKHKVYSKTLLPKILQTTGGRMRIAVSGGGALPTHVDEL